MPVGVAQSLAKHFALFAMKIVDKNPVVTYIGKKPYIRFGECFIQVFKAQIRELYFVNIYGHILGYTAAFIPVYLNRAGINFKVVGVLGFPGNQNSGCSGIVIQ